MEWTLQRRLTTADWMFGALDAGGAFACFTLEDELRERKVHGETAIPAGRYRVTMEKSPRFGPDTLTLVDVKGFAYIRVHGGNSDKSTEGCLIVGNRIDEEKGEIYGAKNAGVLDQLKAAFKAARDSGEEVWLTIRNAPGDRYVDSGQAAGVA